MKYCIGYGSLVCEKSARETVPDLQDFRLCYLPGYQRVFGKVNTYRMFKEKTLSPDRKCAAIYIEKRQHRSPLVVSCFQVPGDIWPVLQERECDYYEEKVTVTTIDDGKKIQGNVFVGYGSDEAMMRAKRQSLDEVYAHWPSVRNLYKGDIYASDILPSDSYLDMCLSAFVKYGDDILHNFLETTFLADKKTTIFEYLKLRRT